MKVFSKFGRKSPFKNSKSPKLLIEIMEIDTWWIKNVIQNPTYFFLRNFTFKFQTAYCVTA